jgi:hypothetical protein
VYETTRPSQRLFDSNWDVWVFSLARGSVRLSESERRMVSACRRAMTRLPMTKPRE